MLNIAYFGTPQLSANLLKMLLSFDDITVKLVVTQPNKPSGKNLSVKPSIVKIIADEYNLETKDYNIKVNEDDLCQKMIDLNIDLAILFAYGEIISEKLLQSPKYGFINVHPSLLPKYRGASPTVFPFLLGEKETGVSIIKMSKKLDEGPIICQKEIIVDSSLNKIKFEEIVPEVAFLLLKQAFYNIKSGNLVYTNQNHKNATYTRLLTKDHGFITPQFFSLAILNSTTTTLELPEIYKWYMAFNRISALNLGSAGKTVFNMYLGLNPWPGIWSVCKNTKGETKRFKILSCKYLDDRLEIIDVQVEGKTTIKFKDFIKSYSLSQ